MKKNIFMLVTMILLVSLTFVGCTRKGGTKDDDTILIGLSFSDFATERWPVEQALMTKLAGEAGAQVIAQVANQDAKLQNDQIENMVLSGADVIIIIAQDGAACATAVEQAAKNGVPCIAYDRLIKTDKLAAYISFDNVEVGRQQAQGVLKVKDKGNFVLLGGSPTDNNAHLFRKGQMDILQPLIDNGDITIVGDQWVDSWDPAIAVTKMENILTANNNDIDAVVASNDGTAVGAIQALKAQGLAGVVPISGQDATVAGCRSIVEGELTMTVFKDVRLLSPMAVEMAITLAEGKALTGLTNFKLADLTLEEGREGEVPCRFLEVVQVDQQNVYDVVIKSKFQDWEEVYNGIPENQRPPKP